MFIKWVSECGSWTRNISTAWELVRNTDSWAPSKCAESEMLSEAQESVLTSTPGNADICLGVRTTGLLKGKKAVKKRIGWISVKFSSEVHTLTLLSGISPSGKLSLTPPACYRSTLRLAVPFWHSHIPLFSNCIISIIKVHWLLIRVFWLPYKANLTPLLSFVTSTLVQFSVHSVHAYFLNEWWMN